MKTKGPKDPQIKQLMMVRRRKVEELCRVVPLLSKKGRWVFSKAPKKDHMKSVHKLNQRNSQQCTP